MYSLLQTKAETLQEQLAWAQDQIGVLPHQLEEARALAWMATAAAAGARSGDSDR